MALNGSVTLERNVNVTEGNAAVLTRDSVPNFFGRNEEKRDNTQLQYAVYGPRFEPENSQIRSSISTFFTLTVVPYYAT
jgi:hypothetical protein